MTDMQALLDEREKTHGRFADVAEAFAGGIRDVVTARVHSRLSDTQFLALCMFEGKKARILAGDPNWIDHWRDIAGFALLVVRELEGRGE